MFGGTAGDCVIQFPQVSRADVEFFSYFHLFYEVLQG